MLLYSATAALLVQCSVVVGRAYCPVCTAVALTRVGVCCAFERVSPTSRFMVVLESGSAAPTSGEVKAGQGPGGTAPKSTASAVGGQGGTTITASANGLEALTEYEVYLVAQDGAATPNVQATPHHLHLSTQAPGPYFHGGYPKVCCETDKSLELTVRMTKAGRFYFLAVPTSVTSNPTAVEVRDNTFAEAVSSGNEHVPPGLVEATATVTGLEPSTAYRVWVVAEDQESPPNLQQNPTVVVDTTAQGEPPHASSLAHSPRFSCSLRTLTPPRGSLSSLAQTQPPQLLLPAFLALPRVVTRRWTWACSSTRRAASPSG